MSVKVLASKTYMLHDIQKIQSEFLKSKYLKKKKKKKKKRIRQISALNSAKSVDCKMLV